MNKKILLKRAEDYYIKVLLKQVKLSEIMSTPVFSVDINEKFTEIPKKFRQHHIRHLPIIGGDNKLVGLISQKDLFRIHPPHKTLDGEWLYDEKALEDIILKHVMLQNPFFMYENDCMGAAIVKFVQHKYGCIPIVNQDMQLKGIVTQEDVLGIAAQIFLEE